MPFTPELDIDPYSEENLLDPYPMHQRIRDAGPVVWLKQYNIYACARHQEVHAVLSEWKSFISGAGVGLANFNLEAPFRPKSLLLEADPPLHTQTRAVLAKVLSPSAMTRLRDTLMVEAEILIDRILRKGTIDGIADLAVAFPLKVFPDAVGLDDDGRENLLLYGDMVFNSMGPRNELFERSAARVVPITRWIMEHCQRDRLRPGSFGAQIYDAADAGDIGLDQAPLIVRSLLSAGVDTTINGLGNALYCLAHHPDQYAKLHRDPGLARSAFEEALRFESTAQTFYRTAGCDTEIAGVPIPHNGKVLLFLAAANRDPRKWPAPDRYDIERRPVGHMAFGWGIHGCIGQAIARLEGEVVLNALARRVQRIEPVGPPTRRLNNTLRALASLPLHLIPA